MDVRDKTYWWVSCDHAGCCAGDNTDDHDSDFNAEQAALAHVWVKIDGLWFCPEHASEKGPRQ